MSLKHLIASLLFTGCMLSFFHSPGAFCEDKNSWYTMQKLFEEKKVDNPDRKENKADPWKRLQILYLPFTEAVEEKAVTDRHAAREISGFFSEKLKPYAGFIREASKRFTVPEEIVAGVIMVESGGNPAAKAKTSSASGLMQTIRSTFVEARTGLKKKGISIEDNPFNPRSSIMAGTWYLDRMYDLALADGRIMQRSRDSIRSWKYPLEYYYAGPLNGKKKKTIVIMYSGGRKVVIDKPAYSRKVLRWATIMKQSS